MGKAIRRWNRIEHIKLDCLDVELYPNLGWVLLKGQGKCAKCQKYGKNQVFLSKDNVKKLAYFTSKMKEE